jgi:hypothetical protein
LLPDLVRNGHRAVTADPGRRNPDLVALGKARGRLGAATVDADLTGTDHPVNGRSGNTLELSGQEIVQPLAVVVPADAHQAHSLVVLR